MPEGSGGSVEAEVRGYGDSLDRTRRREVLRQRVNDGRIMRRIGTGRRAGVLADGARQHPETGVVPGVVLAPVLATIGLPQVLEEWCAREVRPRLQGRAFRMRLADACCIGCARPGAARTMLTVRPKRFARVGLPSHAEKTALIACGTPNARPVSAPGNGTCALLGWTHDGAKARRGLWVIQRRTARTRRRRTQTALWRWCRANRPAPVTDPYQRRGRKWRGHVRSDGIRRNFRLREEVRRDAEQAWRDWLSRRRSQSTMGWEQCQRRLQTPVLPTPTIVHTL